MCDGKRTQEKHTRGIAWREEERWRDTENILKTPPHTTCGHDEMYILFVQLNGNKI